MRIHSILLAFASALAVTAAEPAAPQDSKSAAGQTPREVAIDNMLAERGDIPAFESVIADARKCGVSEQAILEARFLYHVDRREDAKIAALLPEFIKRKDDFKPGDSAVFALKDDWLAVIEYVQAIDSLEKKDAGAFKRHITEAFWLSPRQASAFAPHVERLRLQEAMRSVKIDFAIKLASMNSGDAVSLESLVSGKKALLLHFWAPMSRECEASMPDFAATAATLAGKGIAVVSLVPDDSPKTLTDARAVIRPLGDKPPGSWLIDSKDKSLGEALRIQDIPSMVLVSTEGAILFNGDPADDGFWEALKKVDGAIIRPMSGSDRNE